MTEWAAVVTGAAGTIGSTAVECLPRECHATVIGRVASQWFGGLSRQP